MRLEFVGRKREFEELDEELESVRNGSGSLVTIRGRRQVGKSRLVQEYLNRRALPHAFFTASAKARPEELRIFREELDRSPIPITGVPAGVVFETWEAAFELIASRVTPSAPAVVVLDEFPYLARTDEAVEATLQKIWDRTLARAPVMLIVIGSDVSMMEAITAYGRPLYHRATRELVVEPLTPRDVAGLLRLKARDAFQAYLVTGGFPGVLRDWQPGASRGSFLHQQLARANSSLVVTGERVLNAEFPASVQARVVLEAIGAGERMFSGIRQRARVSAVQLTRSLKLLVEQKRVVALLQPYSSRPAEEPRYIVADSYLRFWLRFVRGSIEEISRGQGDLVATRVEAHWPSYVGKAVEQPVRDAIQRLAAQDSQPFWGARYVGGWWNRTNTIEVDLVGGATRQRPQRIDFIGSIKWGSAAFGRRDFEELAALRQHVPGADHETKLVAVTPAASDERADLHLDAEALIAAWP